MVTHRVLWNIHQIIHRAYQSGICCWTLILHHVGGQERCCDREHGSLSRAIFEFLEPKTFAASTRLVTRLLPAPRSGNLTAAIMFGHSWSARIPISVVLLTDLEVTKVLCVTRENAVRGIFKALSVYGSTSTCRVPGTDDRQTASLLTTSDNSQRRHRDYCNGYGPIWPDDGLETAMPRRVGSQDMRREKSDPRIPERPLNGRSISATVGRTASHVN